MAEYSVARHEGMPTPQDGLIQYQVARDVLQPGVLLPRTVLGLASPVSVEVLLAYSSIVVGISPQTVIVILFIFTSNFFLFVIQF
jgi:hypothetical protein